MTDERKPETPGMAEVSAKFVDEAEAATATPPPSVNVADDLLVALGREWKEIYGKWVEADVYPDTSDRGAIRKYEKERTALLRAICQLEDQAAEVAAQTVDGVLVQLRMAGTHYHLMERDGEQWANTYAHLTWQAWEGLERLAAPGAVVTGTKDNGLPPLDGETVVRVEELANEVIDLNQGIRRLLNCDLEEIPTTGQVLTFEIDKRLARLINLLDGSDGEAQP